MINFKLISLFLIFTLIFPTICTDLGYATSLASKANNNIIPSISTENQAQTTISNESSLLFLRTATTLSGNQTITTNNTFHVQNMAYIEESFRIINSSANKPNGHAGIVWMSGDERFYVFLRPSSSLLSMHSPNKGEFVHTRINPHIVNNATYTVRIAFSDDIINVFLNKTLTIHISQIAANNDISNIGIRTFNSVAEFWPVKIVEINNTHYSEQSAIPWLPPSSNNM